MLAHSFFVIISRLVTAVAIAESNIAMTKKFIEPQAVGYSNAVSYGTAGGLTTITLSGQTGADSSGEFPADLGEQADIALRSIHRILASQGAGLGDIVMVKTYIVNISDARAGPVMNTFGKFFQELSPDRFFASTWVGVTGLAGPVDLEIECTAILGGNVAKKFIEPQAVGYSNAVSYGTSGGIKTITVSGQTGADNAGKFPADLGEQADIALRSIHRVLASQGAGLGDIISINTYIVGISDARAGPVMNTFQEFFKKLSPDRFFASTWVGVTGLAGPVDLEIECTAVLPAKTLQLAEQLPVEVAQRGWSTEVQVGLSFVVSVALASFAWRRLKPASSSQSTDDDRRVLLD